jgi:hypothetical protein
MQAATCTAFCGTYSHVSACGIQQQQQPMSVAAVVAAVASALAGRTISTAAEARAALDAVQLQASSIL